MSIIGTLTPTFANGDLEDATVVMALFAFIRAQVNANAAVAGPLAASGITGAAASGPLATSGITGAAASGPLAASGITGAAGSADVQAQAFTAFTTAGTSTAYTLTPSPALAAYVAGTSFFATFHAASGAAPTLAISGVATPPNLVKENPDGTFSNIAAGDIPINHRSRVTLLSATQAWVETLPDVSLGRGQTLQNVAASRALTTIFTNSTGRPVFVEVTISASATGVLVGLVGGVQVDVLTLASGFGGVRMVVPNGSTYQVTFSGTGTLNTWIEVR